MVESSPCNDGPETKSTNVARYKHSERKEEHGNAQHAARHIAVGLVSLKLFKKYALRIVQISQPVVPHAWPKWNTTPVRISSRPIQNGNDKCPNAHESTNQSSLQRRYQSEWIRRG
jgi:hypothetical protein